MRGRRLFAAAGAAALIVSALAAAGATARVDTAAQPQAASACQLGNGVQARHQHRFRQRPLRAGQPERPVGSRADAAPARTSSRERHGVLELAHADDRAHRRRQPVDLHGSVRRPARPAAVELVQGVQPGWVDRSGDLVRLLDVADHGHEGERPAGSESGGQHAVDGGPATARSPRRRGCRSRGPVARSATSRPRTWCSRTPATSRRCSAPTRRRRRRQPRTPAIRSRTSRSPSTSARRCTAPRAPASARARPARSPTSSRTSRAATTGSRACSGRSTSTRRSAAARISSTTATR